MFALDVGGCALSLLVAALGFRVSRTTGSSTPPPEVARSWSTFAVTWYTGMLAFYVCFLTLLLTLHPFRPAEVQAVVQGALYPFGSGRVPVHAIALLLPAGVPLLSHLSATWRRRGHRNGAQPAEDGAALLPVMQCVFAAVFVLGMAACLAIDYRGPDSTALTFHSTNSSSSG
jgi:hypothetical protein